MPAPAVDGEPQYAYADPHDDADAYEVYNVSTDDGYMETGVDSFDGFAGDITSSGCTYTQTPRSAYSICHETPAQYRARAAQRHTLVHAGQTLVNRRMRQQPHQDPPQESGRPAAGSTFYSD